MLKVFAELLLRDSEMIIVEWRLFDTKYVLSAEFNLSFDYVNRKKNDLLSQLQFQPSRQVANAVDSLAFPIVNW